jgi:hypothetical protein
VAFGVTIVLSALVEAARRISSRFEQACGQDNQPHHR